VAKTGHVRQPARAVGGREATLKPLPARRAWLDQDQEPPLLALRAGTRGGVDGSTRATVRLTPDAEADGTAGSSRCRLPGVRRDGRRAVPHAAWTQPQTTARGAPRTRHQARRPFGNLAATNMIRGMYVEGARPDGDEEPRLLALEAGTRGRAAASAAVRLASPPIAEAGGRTGSSLSRPLST